MASSHLLMILGMHRSGTSALSGAIACSGVYFGDDLLDAEAGVNDKGFWEHRELVSINEALLSQAGIQWHTPNATQHLNDVNANPAAVDALWQRAIQLIQFLVADHAAVAIKDPRLCLLAPFWRAVCNELNVSVSVVHLLRHPAQVQASLARRDGIQADHANALWLEHVSSAQQFCAQLSTAALQADYADLLRSPTELIARLQQSLPIPLQLDVEKLKHWIEPSLQHHTAESGATHGVLGAGRAHLYSGFAFRCFGQQQQASRRPSASAGISLAGTVGRTVS